MVPADGTADALIEHIATLIRTKGAHVPDDKLDSYIVSLLKQEVQAKNEAYRKEGLDVYLLEPV